MKEPPYLPHNRRAIGSSYFIQQSPGAELIGGLEVVLRSPESEIGRIIVSNTLWQSDETRDDIGDFQQQTVDGIHDFAKQNGMDLSRFDIELRKFVFHDVDSSRHRTRYNQHWRRGSIHHCGCRDAGSH